jgi:hypothetical protein
MNEPLTALHVGDNVQEIATGWRGRIQGARGVVGQQPELWLVYLSDGKKAQIKHFKRDDLHELRLINCPHEPVEPCFVPSSSII